MRLPAPRGEAAAGGLLAHTLATEALALPLTTEALAQSLTTEALSLSLTTDSTSGWLRRGPGETAQVRAVHFHPSRPI